ncbi:MAG: protein-methionine-sulfoxide reductase catalytic subunit MsrP [Candidatus Tectomicrobia bacterium]|nr:protein-methionine-sulfoxide reductase catalytic subunit MsrP [Candidatus Tectomicrobia bacterium]
MAPLVRRRRVWEITEQRLTPEGVYWTRRDVLRAMGVITGLSATGLLAGCNTQKAEKQFEELSGQLPQLKAPHQPKYVVEDPLTEERFASRYNNFYEFSSSKRDVWKRARFATEPWKVDITGLIHKPQTLDVDDLRRIMPLEERHYRFRCVEAWAMDVPWIGFPMRALLERVQPMAKARYVRMTTAHFTKGKSSLFTDYPWPYAEGLTLAEAMNELTLLAVGIYGHVLPTQHGAPMRLVVPWKYGFKSIKSIVRIELTDTQPATFWHAVDPGEYSFLANVEPSVPHPRWSQATERVLGTDDRRPTLLYNGYAEYVAHLYKASRH